MAQALYNGVGNEDDVWDDTELVHHFDKALEASRKFRGSTVLEADTPGPWLPLHEGERELENSENTEQPLVLNSENSNQSITFGDIDIPREIGSVCRALYSEDNVEYEAKILELLDSTTCIVRFVGYGNEEQVALSSLKPSNGKKARDLQRMQALQLLPGQNKPNGHEDEAAVTEKTSDVTVGATPNGQIPPEYEELRERVRNIIFSTHNVCEESIPQEESFESRYQQIQSTRRNKKKNVSRAHAAASTSGTNFTGGFASTSGENVFSAPKPNSPPQTNSFGQDSWKDAFPNLLMPPMPNSLANREGKFSFGKGELPSLLMTWYMAGYHSGAFDARQEMRKKMAENRSAGFGGMTEKN